MAKFYTKGMRGILREKALTLKKKIQRYSKRKVPQMTVADWILLSAGQLKGADISPFTRQYLKEMLPDINPSTVSTQIQSMTINTPGHGVCGEKYRKKCFERIARGQYVLTAYGENLLDEINQQFINGIEPSIVSQPIQNEEGEEQTITIPSIILKWSPWYAWETFGVDMRSSSKGVRVPNDSGVYEVKMGDGEERLTIGKASNLRMRVKQGLVKGKVPHSVGIKIKLNEDTSKVLCRWATTDRPSCVEEELHRQYRQKFGMLPKYTLHT